MVKNFYILLPIYTIGSMICLAIALSPLSYYIYFLFSNIQSLDYTHFFIMPLGIAFLWLIGFLVFITIHGRIFVRLVLPSIPEGTFPIMSNINRTYSLRLSADNIAKYWCKSLEWIPFLSQLFLYKQSLQAYGVKFGKNIYLATETRIDGISLIEIGNNFFIGPRGVIGGHINLKGGEIMYKKVKIGNNCFVGSLSILTPGCEMGDNSILGGASITLPETIIPANETWIGMPAKPIKKGSKEVNIDS